MNDEIVEVSEKKPSKAYERISLGELEAQKVAAWITQVEAASQGFLSLSKGDIINFMIREQKSELTKAQVNQIRSDHYEPLRHINWIGQQLKDALSRGDMEAVVRLQAEIRGIELRSTRTLATDNQGVAKPRRQRKNKTKKVDDESKEKISYKEFQSDLPEG